MIVEVSRLHTIIHTHTVASTGVISSSRRPLPAQNTSYKREKHPRLQRDSNPRSQQLFGRRITSYRPHGYRARLVKKFQKLLNWRCILARCASQFTGIRVCVASCHTTKATWRSVAEIINRDALFAPPLWLHWTTNFYWLYAFKVIVAISY